MSTSTQSTAEIALSFEGETIGSVSKIGRDSMEHYRELKEETRQRIGYAELTNAEFVQLLLDVYQYHLDHHAQ